MEEQFVTSERGRTYYWISKCGESARAVVFLHGLTADHRLFDRQMEAFLPRYTVVVWDAPAHGKSRPYADFTYANVAEELKRILDAEGISHAVFVGQSMGGFVAQSFIAKYPSMADGLVTIGTCPYGTQYYSKSDFFWLRQIEWMARLYGDKLLRKAMARMCGATAYGRENMLEMLRGYDRDELCRLMYLGFAGFIPEVRDLDIPCPVCLTVGARDHTGKVMAYNKHWHEVTGYPLHILPNAAHNANADNPEAMNRIIEEFIQNL